VSRRTSSASEHFRLRRDPMTPQPVPGRAEPLATRDTPPYQARDRPKSDPDDRCQDRGHRLAAPTVTASAVEQQRNHLGCMRTGSPASMARQHPGAGSASPALREMHAAEWKQARLVVSPSGLTLSSALAGSSKYLPPLTRLGGPHQAGVGPEERVGCAEAMWWRCPRTPGLLWHLARVGSAAVVVGHAAVDDPSFHPWPGRWSGAAGR
jgi:hypothetical protein